MKVEIDKSILITGAGSGIGRETARLFAQKGWLVGAADINTVALKSLVAELGSKRVIPLVADVTTRQGAAELVKQFVQHTDEKLTVLFNCAGVLSMGPQTSLTNTATDQMINVNIHGVVNCTDAAFDALERTPESHVISMCSTSAEYGVPDLAIYSGTKFFVRGFTEALNIEWEHHGINVSAILVAYVQTPMVHDAKVKAKSIETVGVKVKPLQVAQAVWKAAHRKKTLWRVGVDATALNVVVRLLGSNCRSIYKSLTGY